MVIVHHQLLTVEFEHFALFEPAFQMVVDMDGPHAGWCTRIEQVTRLQGKELRDIGDDLIHLVEHIGGASFLHGLTIDVEVEVDALGDQGDRSLIFFLQNVCVFP